MPKLNIHPHFPFALGITPYLIFALPHLASACFSALLTHLTPILPPAPPVATFPQSFFRLYTGHRAACCTAPSPS